MPLSLDVPLDEYQTKESHEKQDYRRINGKHMNWKGIVSNTVGCIILSYLDFVHDWLCCHWLGSSRFFIMIDL